MADQSARLAYHLNRISDQSHLSGSSIGKAAQLANYLIGRDKSHVLADRYDRGRLPILVEAAVVLNLCQQLGEVVHLRPPQLLQEASVKTSWQGVLQRCLHLTADFVGLVLGLQLPQGDSAALPLQQAHCCDSLS